MCQTQVISNHIGRIGRRSFDRRMRIVSPLYVERRGEIARLLNEVDALSERLHDEFRQVKISTARWISCSSPCAGSIQHGSYQPCEATCFIPD